MIDDNSDAIRSYCELKIKRLNSISKTLDYIMVLAFLMIAYSYSRGRDLGNMGDRSRFPSNI